MRGIFIDLETGGLYPRQHALLSIAVVAFEIDSMGAFILDEQVWLVEPHKETGVTLAALGIQGIGWDSLQSSARIPESEALMRLWQWLQDYKGLALFAHNASFDREHLAAAIKRSGKPEMSEMTGRHAAWVCTINLANALIAFLCMERPEEGLSLDKLAAHLGVQGRSTQAHDALEDARIGVRIVGKLARIAGWTI